MELHIFYLTNVCKSAPRPYILSSALLNCACNIRLDLFIIIVQTILSKLKLYVAYKFRLYKRTKIVLIATALENPG